MKSLAMYSDKTSAYELFTYLSGQIIEGKIETYNQLEEALNNLPQDRRTEFAAQRSFLLLKKMYWGFFRDLDPVKYPRMWKKLIIRSSSYPQAGELKRNMTITSLFCGLLDIHGYTEFCQKAGKNISMLKLLDEVIHEDIIKFAQANDVICRRARGDEIILLGSRPSSVLQTILTIIDYFQRRKVVNHKSLSKARMGHKIILPNMTVSAGVTGGQKYTPLIITADGDLSGHLINSAARLQGRANKLAPKETKILLSSHVYSALQREAQSGIHPEWDTEYTFFWNAGQVGFKGTNLWTYEMIISPKGQYKKQLKEPFTELLVALKKEKWEQQVFVCLLNLISRTVKAQGPFTFIHPITGKKGQHTEIIYLCEEGLVQFVARRQYNLAVDTLDSIMEILLSVHHFDATVREYALAILPKYRLLSHYYRAKIETILDEKLEFLLPLKVREIYNKTKKSQAVYTKIRNEAINNPELGNRVALWHRGIEKHLEDLTLNIYSAK